MGILKNRIDFTGIISANCCNPNGDPTNGNLPRIDFDGYGFITDVCLKRKIRDRLMEQGHETLIQPTQNVTDELYSTSDRVRAVPELKKLEKEKDKAGFSEIACEKWIDVRSFGQVFAFKSSGSSIGVRGPVSVSFAHSIDIIDIQHVGITKAANTDTPKGDTQGRDSTTLSLTSYIDHGVYVFNGSITCQMAEKTGFTDDDAEAIKLAIINMFQNDASRARPAGSMVMEKVFWWKHNCGIGQYSPAKVFATLDIEPSDTAPYYTFSLNNLPGLEPEIIDGW